MKRFMLLLVICLALSGANKPTLNVSCNPCASGSAIMFSGDGYPQSQSIDLEVFDPSGFAFEGWIIQPNGTGAFSVTTSDLVQVGQWKVVTYTLHHNDQNHRILVAIQLFSVQ